MEKIKSDHSPYALQIGKMVRYVLSPWEERHFEDAVGILTSSIPEHQSETFFSSEEKTWGGWITNRIVHH
jgi:hypothetical protein